MGRPLISQAFSHLNPHAGVGQPCSLPPWHPVCRRKTRSHLGDGCALCPARATAHIDHRAGPAFRRFCADPVPPGKVPGGFLVAWATGVRRTRVRIGVKVLGAVVLGAAASATASAADCFSSAAHRHGLDPALLRAIASAESDMRVDAINLAHRQRTGTIDIGLMQVNSGWLPRLASFGIAAPDLHQPCTNIDVGAWILAESFARHGNDWRAVGAYNAACTQLKDEACTRQRARYAWRVYRRLSPGVRVGAGRPLGLGVGTAAMPTAITAHRAHAAPPPTGLLRVSLQGVNP